MKMLLQRQSGLELMDGCHCLSDTSLLVRMEKAKSPINFTDEVNQSIFSYAQEIGAF
jgi:hypothetical protein